MGGVIFPQAQVIDVCAAAREHGLACYLDGARLWNVSAATGLPVAELAAPFDLVMVSMSKGLGAPAGSLLAGPRELIGPKSSKTHKIHTIIIYKLVLSAHARLHNYYKQILTKSFPI